MPWTGTARPIALSIVLARLIIGPIIAPTILRVALWATALGLFIMATIISMIIILGESGGADRQKYGDGSRNNGFFVHQKLLWW